MTKTETVLRTLRKNKWVPRTSIAEAIGVSDLRPLRHLREKGYTIESRRKDGIYEYRRTN